MQQDRDKSRKEGEDVVMAEDFDVVYPGAAVMGTVPLEFILRS